MTKPSKYSRHTVANSVAGSSLTSESSFRFGFWLLSLASTSTRVHRWTLTLPAGPRGHVIMACWLCRTQWRLSISWLWEHLCVPAEQLEEVVSVLTADPWDGLEYTAEYKWIETGDSFYHARIQNEILVIITNYYYCYRSRLKIFINKNAAVVTFLGEIALSLHKTFPFSYECCKTPAPLNPLHT